MPDVDAAMHFGDVPVAQLATMKGTPPLFAPCSSNAFAEIPFPDFTYWGNTGPNQQRSWQVQHAGSTVRV